MEEIKFKIVMELKDSFVVAFSCDGWKSDSNQSYLGVTCHFIDNNMFLRNFVLCLRFLNQDHTAEFLYNTLTQILNEWDTLSKVKIYSDIP